MRKIFGCSGYEGFKQALQDGERLVVNIFINAEWVYLPIHSEDDFERIVEQPRDIGYRLRGIFAASNDELLPAFNPNIVEPAPENFDRVYRTFYFPSAYGCGVRRPTEELALACAMSTTLPLEATMVGMKETQSNADTYFELWG